jgi:hypothetical protein
MRFTILRRKLARQRDPAVAALLDDELNRAITRATAAIAASPRPGLRRWLRELEIERTRRRWTRARE